MESHRPRRDQHKANNRRAIRPGNASRVPGTDQAGLQVGRIQGEVQRHQNEQAQCTGVEAQPSTSPQT